MSDIYCGNCGDRDCIYCETVEECIDCKLGNHGKQLTIDGYCQCCGEQV